MGDGSHSINQRFILSESTPHGIDTAVVRHITRYTHGHNASLAELYKTGTYKKLFWPEIFVHITNAVKTNIVKMDIVDTVEMERLEVKHYCYTDAEGTAMLKPRGEDLQSVYEQFMKIAHAIRGDKQVKNAAICYKYGSSTAIMLDADAFEAFCFQTVLAPSFSSEIGLLQCFLPAKGNEEQYRTYRTSYWLDKNSSVPSMKTVRLDVSQSITGNASIKAKTHMGRHDNQVMQANVFAVVGVIEKFCHCRVTKASFDFVQDVHDKNIRTEYVAQTQRDVREDRENRMEQQREQQHQLQQQQEQTNGTSGSPLPSNHPSALTSHVANMRWQKKHSRKGKRGIGGPKSPTTRIRPEVSEATLGKEIPELYGVSPLLGSSQLHGVCPGDFCAFNVSSLNPLAGSVGITGMDTMGGGSSNAFRRRIASMTVEETYDDEELPDSLESTQDPLLEEGKKRTRAKSIHRSTGRTRHLDIVREQEKAIKAGFVVNLESDPLSTDMKISFRSILQARQEMPLVRMQLSRHANGGKGDYVNEDNLHHMEAVGSVSGKLSSLYYQEVPVCMNCYKIYSVVDDARHKALRKLEMVKQQRLREAAERRKEKYLYNPRPSLHYRQLTQSKALSLISPGGALSPTGSVGLTSASGSPSFFPSPTGSPYGYSSSMISLISTNSNANGGNMSPQPLPSPSPLSPPSQPLPSSQSQKLTGRSGTSLGSKHSHTLSPNNQSLSPVKLPLGLELGLGLAGLNFSNFSLSHSSSSTSMIIEGITKQDLSDIKRLVNPPPAVVVVLEAVVVLLTGRALPFEEIRRLIQTDAFALTFQSFRVEDVTDGALAIAEGYTNNPLFRPNQVARVSAWGAKFCTWVLGVVQAAKDQRFLNSQAMPSSLLGDEEEESVDFDGLGPGHDDAREEGIVEGGILPQPYQYNPPSNSSSNQPPSSSSATVDNNSQHATAGTETSPSQPTATSSIVAQFRQWRGEISPGGLSPSPLSPASYSHNHYYHHSHSIDSPSSGSSVVDPHRTPSRGGNPLPWEMANSITINVGSGSRGEVYSPSRASPSRGSPSRGSPSRGMGPGIGGMKEVAWPIRVEEQRGSTAERQRLLTKASQTIQRQAMTRMAAQKDAYIPASSGIVKECRCPDGLTTLPYIILGKLSARPKRCNFVVVHDFFDTLDATSLMLKQITQRHDGCQAMCFNYPGQAFTKWPVLSSTEKDRGGIEPLHTCDWLADRLHELLQHIDSEGEMLLGSPFHLVGMGNGSTIAAAFLQRYGKHPSYAHSLRSFVSVNGYLAPDPQLRAILHSAASLFDSTPATRPDIPFTFWTRFMFSEDYLNRVNQHLALNLYTAVSNPITSEGRAKLARGALQHRDMRGGLAPSLPDRHIVSALTVTHPSPTASQGPGLGPGSIDPANGGDVVTLTSLLTLAPVQVPVIVLQSTENLLVNPSHADSFVAGRNTHHLWSHQLNLVTPPGPNIIPEVMASLEKNHWVGQMASGPHDYARYSSLGKGGLQMLLHTLGDAQGAMVVWVKAGHCLQQEHKAVLLDCLDALALPNESYLGNVLSSGSGGSSLGGSSVMSDEGYGSLEEHEGDMRTAPDIGGQGQSRIEPRMEPGLGQGEEESQEMSAAEIDAAFAAMLRDKG